MKCPICNKPSMVIDSRKIKKGTEVARRRECTKGHRFSTREVETVGLTKLRKFALGALGSSVR